MENDELTLCCTHTHDCFHHNGHGNNLSKFVRKLDSIFRFCRIEGGIEVCLTGRIMGQACCGGTVSKGDDYNVLDAYLELQRPGKMH